MQHQGILFEQLHHIFPNKHILQNVRKKGNIHSHDVAQFLELDFWIPELNLSFEFQDKYHYEETWNAHVLLEATRLRDDTKRGKVHERGDTLIEVPYWWDGSAESLIASVCRQRPELSSYFQSSLPLSGFCAEPIPFHPPTNEETASNRIPNIGALMVASFCDHVSFDATHWWLSEKYDGVRGCWHPIHKKLYSKNGRSLPVPNRILSSYPSHLFLDGEIWFGKSSFGQCQETLYSAAQKNWDLLRYITFDLPQSDLPFEKRISEILQNTDREIVILATHLKCAQAREMDSLLQKILKSVGEGLILRAPRSLYSEGRSDSFYKLKVARDHEGLVLSFNPDASSCTILLPDSQVTEVPLSQHFQNAHSLKYGDIVTFSFSNLSHNGIPVSAQIERVRTDVTWGEIQQNGAHYLQETGLFKCETRSKRESGYWSNPDAPNSRRFFEEFAAKMNFQSPEEWYHVKRDAVLREPGGASILLHYNGSLIKALLDLFPAWALDESKFASKYWLSNSNRKAFFEDFARKHQFDFSIPENWYHISHASVKNEKGGAALLQYYGNSLAKALCDLFPDIDLQERLFTTRDFWNSDERVREFFVEYADEHGFDPWQPSNWSQVTSNDIKMTKGGRAIMQKYSSVKGALEHAFPEIRFESTQAHAYLNWHTAETRRTYLTHFARRYSLDPLDHTQWSQDAFKADKNGRYILGFYGGSLQAALQDMFPCDSTPLPAGKVTQFESSRAIT